MPTGLVKPAGCSFFSSYSLFVYKGQCNSCSHALGEGFHIPLVPIRVSFSGCFLLHGRWRCGWVYLCYFRVFFLYLPIFLATCLPCLGFEFVLGLSLWLVRLFGCCLLGQLPDYGRRRYQRGKTQDGRWKGRAVDERLNEIK